MSTSAISYAETPDVSLENQAARRTFIEKNCRRARAVPSIVGQIGLLNTVHLARDVLSKGRRERQITVHNKLFREPLSLTTSRPDIGTLLEIASRQVYKLPASFSECLQGRQIIDMGAHIGLAAVYFANRYPQSEILSFEPNPRNFDYLQSNAVPYAGQIEPVNAALAAKPGLVGSRLTGSDPNNHVSYAFGGDPAGDELRAAAVTPDEILEITPKKIGLVKVDIEGAEKELFDTGAMDGLLGHTQVMMIETHDQYQPGSSEAVRQAAKRTKLQLYSNDGHTTIYSRI